jgi:hypothetical protein
MDTGSKPVPCYFFSNRRYIYEVIVRCYGAGNKKNPENRSFIRPVREVLESLEPVAESIRKGLRPAYSTE